MLNNLCYLTITGSRAYGCEHKDSDYDHIGFCLIPREMVEPLKHGYILGFDSIPKFEQWNKEEFYDEQRRKTIAVTVYGITNYFKLLYDGNPNIIESLFTSRELVEFSNPIGERLRANRHLFLSKQSFYKTRAYAFSQLRKLDRVPEGKRFEDWKIHGYDLKFSAHTIRLIDNCEQILNGDLDLRRNKEMIKSIRNGEFKLEEIREIAKQKELTLEKLVVESKLPEKPPTAKIKNLLIELLQYSYQNLEIKKPNWEQEAIQEIRKILGDR
jgi:predicted nucleotidyltransferase